MAKSRELATEKDGVNFFSEYGKQASMQGNIVGKLLRFSKGDYQAGQEADEVEIGTKLIVNMDSFLLGWVRWEDQKPAEQRMGLLSKGFQPDKRTDLGFNDEGEWAPDPNGQARDPWQFTNQVLMKEPGKRGEMYTFSIASKGGINALGRLCKQYGDEIRERGDDEYPIIELGVDSYPHATYGKIKFPEFKIVGWADKSEFADLSDEPVGKPAKKLKSRAA